MPFDFKKLPKMTLMSDAPLREEDLDGECFGLGNRLGPIFDAIRHREMRTPFSIMVSGGWGTGKTSAMTWLQRQLDNWSREKDKKGHSHVYTCWFHPWKYQSKEDVWRGLIAEVMLKRLESEEKHPAKLIEIAAEFGSYFGSEFLRPVFKQLAKLGIETHGWEDEHLPDPSADKDNDTAIARLKRFFRFGKDIAINAGKISIKVGGKDVELDPLKLGTIAEQYRKNFRPHEAYLNAFEDTLKRELKSWLGDDKRLCIFIDDLDRCMPDVAVQVLEALKLYLNLPGVVFVVGVDRSVLDKVILKRHLDMVSEGDDDEEFRKKAKAYADKMFQVEVNIEPSEAQTNLLFEKLCEQDEATKNFWDNLDRKDIFVAYLKKEAGKNPRTMVRTMNTMLLAAQALQSEDNTLTLAQSLQQVLLRVVALKIRNGDVIKDEACEAFLEGASKLIIELGDDVAPLRAQDFAEEPELTF
jgi:hypothetical protein